MNKSELTSLINTMSTLDDDELEMVVACAKFQKYLKTNIGEKIDLATVSTFANLVGSIVTAVE